MATSDILGLFTTPEQYQLAQRQAQEAEALQYAKLDPMSQAQYGFYRAGQQIGGAIGGALGGEDPQLKLISMRQQLASQLDPSKPESFMQAAELAARSGDQQFAIGLADAGRKAAIQIAQATKERQLAVPVDIQKAQMIPQIQDAIDQYSALPVSPERDRALKVLQNQLKVLLGDTNTKLAVPIQVANRIGEINRTLRTLKPEDPTYQDLIAERDQLQKSEKIPDAIQIAKRVSELETQLSPDAGVVLPPQVRAGLQAELNNLKTQQKENIIDVGLAEKTREVVYFDKDSSEQFIMKPDATGKLVRTPYSGGIDKTTSKVSATSTSTTSGIKEFKDIPDLRAKIIGVVDPFRKAVNATDMALESLDLSITQNNFAGFNAARVQLAKALSGGDLSQKEIAAAGGDPSILGGLVDMASTAFTGTPSFDTQKKIKDTINAIRKVALKKGRDEIEVQRNIAKRSNFNDADFEAASNIPEFQRRNKTPPEIKPFVDADKERRFQEFKRKQLGAK